MSYEPPNTRRHATLLAFALVTITACAHSSPESKVLKQAAFDLKCAESELAIQKISDDNAMGLKNASWGVEGCERQATYKTSCGVGDCRVISSGNQPMIPGTGL